MNKKKMKLKNSGFTLAELLVVVAIIGVLIAISIPIFTAQRRKAIVATNKANIRAAKVSVMTEFYSDSDVQNLHDSKLTAVYYIYNVEKGVLEDKIILRSEDEYDKNGTYTYQGENKDKILKAYKAVYNRNLTANSCNEWGRAFSAYMKQDKICDRIIVFIGSPEDGKKDKLSLAKLQTAPYYDSNGQIGYKGGTSNPFGPLT